MFFKGHSVRHAVIVVIYYQLTCACCQKYALSSEPVNWYQALIDCKSAGMELASVHSVEEQEELAKFLKSDKYVGPHWIAGTRAGNGQFYWATTGVKTIYTNWQHGQPDNARLPINFHEGEKCIQWGPSDVPGWNDFSCEETLPYICQKTQYCYQ